MITKNQEERVPLGGDSQASIKGPCHGNFTGVDLS
jgi:hypothetical protein